MVNAAELHELIDSGAIDTYKGQAEVLVDKRHGLVIIGQGERMLALSVSQACDLIKTLIYKVGEEY